MRTRIKFCGCTNAREAREAIDVGADAIGVIFAPESPRCVDEHSSEAIARAMPPFIGLIGVFIEPSATDVARARALGYMPQFSGDESAALCETAGGPYIKVQHLTPGTNATDIAAAFALVTRDYARAHWMFDTLVHGKRGGTGQTFEWEQARDIAGGRPIIVSGGLTPANVGDCIRRIRPFAVDVRSGIETAGVKDPAKMRAFVRAVREADAQT